MAKRFYLNIARHPIAVSPPEGVEIAEPDPVYRPFTGSNSFAADALEVPIDLIFSPAPAALNARKLFDTHPFWYLYRTQKGYLIHLGSPDSPHHVALAFTLNPASATFYCRREQIEVEDGRRIITNPLRYPLDQILLMYLLSRNGGAIIHSAGIEINGRGYLFPGKSGAGKTTLSRHVAGKRPWPILSDDRIAVRRIEEGFSMFGTPWPGEGRMALNTPAPLCGICFLEKAPTSRLEALSPKAAFEKLLPVTSIPWYDKEVFPGMLTFVEELASQVPTFTLFAAPDESLVTCIETLSKG